jgi:phage FluMu protein Com
MDNIKRVRCQECGVLLFEVEFVRGLVIICSKCKKKYFITIEHNVTLIEEVKKKE